MKKQVILVFFSINFISGNAQTFLGNYNKAVSLSLGVLHIPRLSWTPTIIADYYQNTGPVIAGGIDLSDTNNNSHILYVRYGSLNSYQDTIIYPALYPQDMDTLYGLEGRAELVSLGYSWQRYFGNKLWLQPFTLLGSELLLQHRETQTGYYDASWSSVVLPYIVPSYTILSFNLRCGVGFSHKISARITLFEQVEAGTMIFHSSGTGIAFSPLHDSPTLILFQASFGFTYKLS
ncbi:MAG: hypothetical protein IPM74_04075 [Crocinitomicaceae bacterium]|nr:hypothetical protein [Crocinitomicaceae bacterium]MBK8925085.1 hypothetical protein [Crocinitomicaceae bacterium]